MESPESTSAPVDGKRPLLERILDRVFRCSHRHQALPITLKGETFRICLDCGSHVPYSLKAWQPEKPVKEPVSTPAPPVPKPPEPVNKSKEPVLKAAEPVAKPTQPVTQSTPPATKPTEPATKPAEPVAKPAQTVTKSTPPATKPTEPVAKPKEPVTKPKAPVNQAPAAPKPSTAKPSLLPVRRTLGAWTREGIWLGLLAIGFAGGIYYSNQRQPPPADRVVTVSQPPPQTEPAPAPAPVPTLSPAPATPAAVANTPPASAVRRPNPTPRLQGERGFVLLAREPADALELSKHPGSLGSLVSAGGLFTVPRGTAVRVVGRKESVVQVVILEGPVKGDEGWVAAARLSTE